MNGPRTILRRVRSNFYKKHSVPSTRLFQILTNGFFRYLYFKNTNQRADKILIPTQIFQFAF